MSEKDGRPVCEICGRAAIGIQSLGCCAATVCAEHAEPALRNTNPGETVVWDACCFVRFDAPQAGDDRR